MKAINLIFPHQLFEANPLFENGLPVYLIEEFLYFKQYPFHKQKIAFHRATMKFYENFIKEKGLKVTYVETSQGTSDIRKLIPTLAKKNIEELHYVDTVDYWLEKRIQEGCSAHKIETIVHDSPMFLNTKDELSAFFKAGKKKFHQTSFYTAERKRRNILMNADGKPEGGKWTFDKENRKKYPKKNPPPGNSISRQWLLSYGVKRICQETL